MFLLTLKTLHIVFCGMWLINIFSDAILKKTIHSNRGKSGERKFINLYLVFTNLFGIIGSVGILATGIAMVSMNSGYQFFQMTANHWLTTKQILMVAILVLIGSSIIPTAKKIRGAIGSDMESHSEIPPEGYVNLQKLFRFNTIVNLIVLINFLLAITHQYLF